MKNWKNEKVKKHALYIAVQLAVHTA